MGIGELLVILAIGAVAGWLAGQLIAGGGFGLLGNIGIGLVGSVVGAFVGNLLNGAGHGPIVIPGSPIITDIIWATIGAVIVLLIVKLIKKV